MVVFKVVVLYWCCHSSNSGLPASVLLGGGVGVYPWNIGTTTFSFATPRLPFYNQSILSEQGRLAVIGWDSSSTTVAPSILSVVVVE
jgi:hypothetical protein